jgi:hypothetical protein
MPRKIEQVKFPLQEVSRQLAKIGSSGSFAARLTVAAGDLHLEVQGVGRIRFPLGEDGCRIRARRGGTSELAARVAVAEENDGGFLSEEKSAAGTV